MGLLLSGIYWGHDYKKAVSEKSKRGKQLKPIENVPDGIAIIQDGVLKLVNPALVRISGYSKKELLNVSPTVLVTSEFRDLIVKACQDALAGRDVPSIYELRPLKKDRAVLDIELHTTLTEYEGRSAFNS
jgi:PAS domain S-box-containing protein